MGKRTPRAKSVVDELAPMGHNLKMQTVVETRHANSGLEGQKYEQAIF
jgi:hypothetical protein